METSPLLVSLIRAEFDEAAWEGFIVGRSATLVALHLVGDNLGLDGFRVFPVADVTGERSAFRRRDLIEDALRLKGQAPVVPPGLDLRSMRTAMVSAQLRYGALAIRRERIDPDVVELGAIEVSEGESYRLRELDFDAAWHAEPNRYRYAHVTMLGFDGEYERTLLAVASERERDRRRGWMSAGRA